MNSCSISRIHSSYNLEKVLNFSSCLEKSLNSVKVLEKYLISLLGLEKALKVTTLCKSIFVPEQYLNSVSYFKCCTSDAIASDTQSFFQSVFCGK